MAPEDDVVIRRYRTSQVCDVVVRVRGQEIVHRCPDYSIAIKWARMECKSYSISGPRVLFFHSPATGRPDDLSES